MNRIDHIRQFKPAVLLVEDDELTKKIEEFTFRELGCDVVTAPDAQSALEALDKPYDLVILDVGLPDQSGVRLAEAIRRGRTKQNHSTPIVIVSTYASDTDRERYLTAGATDVLSKPMDHEKIKSLLLKLVEQHQELKT